MPSGGPSGGGITAVSVQDVPMVSPVLELLAVPLGVWTIDDSFPPFLRFVGTVGVHITAGSTELPSGYKFMHAVGDSVVVATDAQVCMPQCLGALVWHESDLQRVVARCVS